MQLARSDIYTAALDLPPEDRAVLADELLNSLTPVDTDLEKVWLEEIDRRLLAYEAGNSVPIPADEVFAEFLD